MKVDMGDNLAGFGAVMKFELEIIGQAQFPSHNSGRIDHGQGQVIGEIQDIGIMFFGADQEVDIGLGHDIGEDDSGFVFKKDPGRFLAADYITENTIHGGQFTVSQALWQGH